MTGSETSSSLRLAPRISVPAEGFSLRMLSQFDIAPTPRLPIRYAERAYVLMGTCVEPELARGLGEVLRDVWQATPRDAWTFIRLGVFAQGTGVGEAPPVATLEWREWHADAKFSCGPLSWSFEPVFTAPAPNDLALPAAHLPSEGETPAERAAEGPPAVTEPLASSADITPRSSKRFGAETADLLGALFLELAELPRQEDALQACRFVLQLIEHFWPCEASGLYLLDIKRRAFTVVAAAGIGRSTTLLGNVTVQDSLFNQTFERRLTRILKAGEPGFPQARLEQRGVQARELMLGPVQHGGRRRAMIELINCNGGNFSEADQEALDYVCAELAQFLVRHSGAFDVAQVREVP